MINVPVIYVRDKHSGNVRIVGTDHHDQLLIEDGAIHYINIQCMCGTRYKDAAYEFVGTENYDGEIVVVMMDLEEYIELMRGIQKEKEENLKALKEQLGLPEDARIIS